MAASPFNYVVSSHPATAVTHAVVGRFIAPDAPSLILAKVSRLEVLAITDTASGTEGVPLSPALEVPVHGRISALECVRLPGDATDTVVFTTERFQFVAIKYDDASKSIRTVAMGDLRDNIGRPVDEGTRLRVAPGGNLIALHMFDGLLKLVAIDKGFKDKAFNVRLPDIAVRDMTFIQPFPYRPPQSPAGTGATGRGAGSGAMVTPTFMLAVLLDDESGNGRAVLKVYDVDVGAKVLRLAHAKPLSKGLDDDACVLKPVQASHGGGVLVLSSTRAAHVPLPAALSAPTAGAGTSGAGGAAGKPTVATTTVAAVATSRPATPASTTTGSSGVWAGASFPAPVAVRAVGVVDGNRWLVADGRGDVHLVAVSSKVGAGGGIAMTDDDDDVMGAGGDVWSVTPCGNTVQASAICHLDGGHVFIASTSGDSTLVRLPAPGTTAASGCRFTQVASFSNLGPIVDMAVVDMERQGQCQVVAACGVGKDGSLRIIRNGIGIAEQAAVELPGITGMWPLRPTTSHTHDKYLVQSFVTETRVLAMEGEEMEEVDLAPGFMHDVPTLCAANVVGDHVVQVTPGAVRLVRLAGGATTLVASWVPEGGRRITLAAATTAQVLVALAGGVLVALEVGAGGSLAQRATRTMPHEVSAVNVNPLAVGAGSPPSHTMLGAVGLWTDMSVHLVAMPPPSAAGDEAGLGGDLCDVAVEPLGGEIQSRSVLLTSMEGHHYLFASLGDGTLFTFKLRLTPGAPGSRWPVAITDRKHMALGTQPVTLCSFSNKGAVNVFAASDRPAILYSSSRKLTVSNVNTGQVTHMCPFHSASFPDCLALASEVGLSIGTVDEIRRLHVRVVPLGEQPRRVVHHRPSKTACVAVETPVDPATSTDAAVWMEPDDHVGACFLRLYDDTTFDRIDSFALDPTEMVLSALVAPLGAADGGAGSDLGEDGATSAAGSGAPSATAAVACQPYIIVGTAYVEEGQDEPVKGRILVLRVATPTTGGERTLQLVATKETRGGVFSLASLPGGKLVAGVNSKVHVYSLGPSRNPATAAATMPAATRGTGVQQALSSECSIGHHTLVLYLDTRGDFILVADLMKSISLLRYKVAEKGLEETAAEPSTNWMAAAAMLDDSTFVGCEHHHNLFTAVRRSIESGSDVHSYLEATGEYHLGDMVNRFGRGSLVMLPTEDASYLTGGGEGEEGMGAGGVGAAGEGEGVAVHAAKRSRHRGPEEGGESRTAGGADAVAGGVGGGGMMMPPKPTLIFATVGGSVGAIINLPPQLYRYLLTVQKALLQVLQGVGGLSHSLWRSWCSDRRTPNTMVVGSFPPSSRGFIDGDVVETLLELDHTAQEQVVAAMNGMRGTAIAEDVDATLHPAGTSAADATLAEVVKVVEHLARLH